jgi:peptidoglycan/xylan/chitin deacetylase (PgdA/CDA1 family)
VYTPNTVKPSPRFICVAGFLIAALAVVHIERLTLFAQSPTVRTIALTFDDLPYLAVEPAEYVRNAERVTDEILRVLRVHNAPAVAFVNEARLQVPGEIDARVAVLKRWSDAGVVLGNHTYSHADFNSLSVPEFEDEIIHGEVVTRRLMEARRPYQLYFRFPETHGGDTAEKKQAVEAFLAERGYKVTPHTIENQDFVFNVLYVKAQRSGDAAGSGRLASAYLDFTFAATAFAEQIAPKVFGRDIPQTLLIHANDITADCLDKLLAGFETRGYRFVTLDEAMSDDAYQTHDTLVTKAGPTWLWRWMKSKGMKVSFNADPEPPAWVSDMYSKH